MGLVCIIRHWWIKLNYCRNYGSWESKVEHIQCGHCGKLALHSKEILQ